MIMFKVIAGHHAGEGHTETISGPFEEKENAERFAIGLARTGKAYMVEIREWEETALLAAHRALELAEETRDKVSIDQTEVAEAALDAVDHLTNAVAALHRYDAALSREVEARR